MISPSHTRLVSGDAITFGSAKIQFWLAPARQRALYARELVWLLIIGMAACRRFSSFC